MTNKTTSLIGPCTAEFVGTAMLIFFGCGVVHSSVAFGAQQGVWQVAIVWGISIMLAIYSVGSISGAHLNPAITIALAAWRTFPVSRILPYILAQVSGAFFAAAVLFALFSGELRALENSKGVLRGGPGSEITAMCYGEYYPNPGAMLASAETYSVQKHNDLKARVPHHTAFIAEVVGTFILALIVFAVTDDRNPGAPTAGNQAIFIGLTVACLISVIAPITQACFNPARDFGPRIFAAMAGWGSIAFPGQDNWSWLTVYIVAPIAGAVLGGAAYTFALQPRYPNREG